MSSYLGEMFDITNPVHRQDRIRDLSEQLKNLKGQKSIGINDAVWKSQFIDRGKSLKNEIAELQSYGSSNSTQSYGSSNSTQSGSQSMKLIGMAIAGAAGVYLTLKG